MNRFLLLAAVCASFASAASAQTPRREPALSDTLQSPEVSSDHHVTFRILAPKASEVTLTGDWLGTTPPPKLSKDERGVWSVTLGPF
jgi:1,4-alpha-glucan branching enzyme